MRRPAPVGTSRCPVMSRMTATAFSVKVSMGSPSRFRKEA
jgi:hypothetical protein